MGRGNCQRACKRAWHTDSVQPFGIPCVAARTLISVPRRKILASSLRDLGRWRLRTQCDALGPSLVQHTELRQTAQTASDWGRDEWGDWGAWHAAGLCRPVIAERSKLRPDAEHRDEESPARLAVIPPVSL